MVKDTPDFIPPSPEWPKEERKRPENKDATPEVVAELERAIAEHDQMIAWYEEASKGMVDLPLEDMVFSPQVKQKADTLVQQLQTLQLFASTNESQTRREVEELFRGGQGAFEQEIEKIKTFRAEESERLAQSREQFPEELLSLSPEAGERLRASIAKQTEERRQEDEAAALELAQKITAPPTPEELVEQAKESPDNRPLPLPGTAVNPPSFFRSLGEKLFGKK